MQIKQKLRRVYRSLRLSASIIIAVILSFFLFTFIFMEESLNEVPQLSTQVHGIPLEESQEEVHEEEVVEATLTPKPDIPQMKMTPELVHVDTPPIKLEYAVAVNIAIGMQVPAPPAFAQPAISQQAFTAGQLDEQPSILYSPRPRYPREALRIGHQGQVIARVIINSDGKVMEVRILPGPDSDLFEKESILALKRWRFKPGKLNGRPVSTIVEVPLIFSLN